MLICIKSLRSKFIAQATGSPICIHHHAIIRRHIVKVTNNAVKKKLI
jgi:hypothetical protein